jgi:FG-GAP repeat protein
VHPFRTVTFLVCVIGGCLLAPGIAEAAGSVNGPTGCFAGSPKAFVQPEIGGAPDAQLWRFTGRQSCARLGNSVGTAGDVNGDGFDDVIVGAEYYDGRGGDEGAAFAFYGSTSGLPLLPDWGAHGAEPSSNFATAVATAGDVNGDGYDEVLVGQISLGGGAFAFYGSGRGLSPTASWTVDEGQSDSKFAAALAAAGDVNGDGYDDVIVGDPWYDGGGQRNEGAAFVYMGSPSGLSTSPGWMAEGVEQDAWFGSSVARAGDVNADGYDDVIVGAALYGGGQHAEGRTFLFLGSVDGLAETASWTAESDQIDAAFGDSVSTAGDVNDDGFDDVIVGAPGFDNPQPGEGRAYVFLGSPDGLQEDAAWTAEGGRSGVGLGTSVGSAGDANGDGFDDVVIGGPGFGGGVVLVVPGSADGPLIELAGVLDGPRGSLGTTSGGAGDVNGDGLGDVIAGAPMHSIFGRTEEGLAMVALAKPG